MNDLKVYIIYKSYHNISCNLFYYITEEAPYGSGCSACWLVEAAGGRPDGHRQRPIPDEPSSETCWEINLEEENTEPVINPERQTDRQTGSIDRPCVEVFNIWLCSRTDRQTDRQVV